MTEKGMCSKFDAAFDRLLFCPPSHYQVAINLMTSPFTAALYRSAIIFGIPNATGTVQIPAKGDFLANDGQ
jgi:hypothetical protein